MPKRKTSREPGFSLKSMPTYKLRADSKTIKAKSKKRLEDREFVFNALWLCLIDNDIESFKEILRTHLEVVNKQQFAKKSKTPRRTLHRILSPAGNPTLKNISNVIHALYG